MSLRIVGLICLVTIVAGVGHRYARRKKSDVEPRVNPDVAATRVFTNPDNAPAPPPRRQPSTEKVGLSLDSRASSAAPNQGHPLALTDLPHSRRHALDGAGLSLDAPVAVTFHDSEQPLSDWADVDADTRVEGAGNSALELPKYGPAFQLPPLKRGR